MINKTMQPQNPQSDMTADQAAAALAYATNLSEQFLPKVQPEAPQTPETAPESTPEPQADPMAEMTALKEEIMSELQAVREDIKLVAQGDVKDEKSEIAELKKQIEAVLNEDAD